MRIIVTGAAGFIGSHLFDYLVKEGHNVMGIDNFSLGTYTNTGINNIDLLDKQKTEGIISYFKPEVIYHLAAWAHEGLSQFMPIKITENNYNAYLNVLIPAINIGVKRMVLVSSMSVYGNAPTPFSEATRREPVDLYGIAKTAMEEATEVLAKVHGMEYNIIRPHNVYGERQNLSDPYRNVVGIFINNALRGKPLFIYGDGKQKRAFSYVHDIIPAISEAGTAQKVFNMIFNVGSPKAYSVNHLAEEIAAHFPEVKIKHVAPRPVEVKDAFCTDHNARLFLGYETKTTLSEGVEKMVAWAKEVGSVEPVYLPHLEIENAATPKTWSDRLI